MSKIKVGELREVLKELKSQQRDVKVVDFQGLKLEIKQFISIQEKINLVASIFESSIDRSGDLHILDGNKLDIAYKNLVVGEYSNLTLPKNTLESYDMLCESGLFDVVYDGIPLDERLLLENVLDSYIDAEKDEYDQRNTIQYIVKDLLQNLINKIPDGVKLEELVKSASEEFANFDPEKMEFLKSAMDWNSGVEK